MTSEEASPLSEILFELVLNLCKAFPALDPFRLRRKEADEVILLINKLSRQGRKKPISTESAKQRKKVYADQVNWF